ncbi:MAG: NUDIX domain-containing protein, partial [Chlamydiae bacterium]|nr:NUDIX domain-containing protein [Chlamydiota bacterium]
MEKHFTAVAFILEKEKVLLIYHNKLRTWLPPGGHVDPNETPVETAIREVKEETGLDITIIQQENTWVDYKEACSFERPYLCLLENIP